MSAKRSELAERVFSELSWDWQSVPALLERLAPIVPPGQAMRRYTARMASNKGARPVAPDFQVYSGQKEIIRHTIWGQKAWLEFRGENDTKEVRLSPRGGAVHSGRCLYCGGTVAGDEQHDRHDQIDLVIEDDLDEGGVVTEQSDLGEDQEVARLRVQVEELQEELSMMKGVLLALESRVQESDGRQDEAIRSLQKSVVDMDVRVHGLSRSLVTTTGRVTEVEATVTSFLSRLVTVVDSVRQTSTQARPEGVRSGGHEETSKRRRNRR